MQQKPFPFSLLLYTSVLRVSPLAIIKYRLPSLVACLHKYLRISSIEFSSPSDYTDLIVVFTSVAGENVNQSMKLRCASFN